MADDFITPTNPALSEMSVRQTVNSEIEKDIKSINSLIPDELHPQAPPAPPPPPVQPPTVDTNFYLLIGFLCLYAYVSYAQIV